jgi:NAD kinase
MSDGPHLTPRVVLVHRRTEREEIIRQSGTWGQAQYLQRSQGVSLEAVQEAHDLTNRALQTVSAAIPSAWRRASAERADLDRFLFEPDDIVVIVGQDGLVANTAKYLTNQPVIGVNPNPARPAVLATHSPDRCRQILALVADGRAQTQRRTMVAATTSDGQELTALNEIYLGHPSHQSSRYELRLPDGRTEPQSSSGVLVGTGTGATGWLLSVARQRSRTPKETETTMDAEPGMNTELEMDAEPESPPLPTPESPNLAWFVREAWPSPTTGAQLTAGTIAPGQSLQLQVHSEEMTIFGDGIESDHLSPTWGQTITVTLSPKKLALVVDQRANATPQAR